MELIEQNHKYEALMHIRQHITPYIIDLNELLKLTELLLTNSSEEFKRLAHWKSIQEQRKSILMEIEKYSDPRLYIQEGRLKKLIQQAQLFQLSQCHYHNSSMEGHSLLYVYT